MWNKLYVSDSHGFCEESAGFVVFNCRAINFHICMWASPSNLCGLSMKWSSDAFVLLGGLALWIYVDQILWLACRYPVILACRQWAMRAQLSEDAGWCKLAATIFYCQWFWSCYPAGTTCGARDWSNGPPHHHLDSWPSIVRSDSVRVACSVYYVYFFAFIEVCIFLLYLVLSVLFSWLVSEMI